MVDLERDDALYALGVLHTASRIEADVRKTGDNHKIYLVNTAGQRILWLPNNDAITAAACINGAGRTAVANGLARRLKQQFLEYDGLLSAVELPLCSRPVWCVFPAHAFSVFSVLSFHFPDIVIKDAITCCAAEFDEAEAEYERRSREMRKEGVRRHVMNRAKALKANKRVREYILEALKRMDEPE